MFVFTDDAFYEKKPSYLCEFLVQYVMMFAVGAVMFPVNVVVILLACFVARWLGCEPQHMKFVVFGGLLSVGPCYYAFQSIEQWVTERH